jgi:hypothetical protein
MLAGLLTASVAGCGTKAAPSGSGKPRTPSSGAPHQANELAARVHCPAFIGGLYPGTPIARVGSGPYIPSGFKPAAAVECVRSVVRVKGRGLWLADVKRVATSGLGPLMTALRMASHHSPSDIACPMIVVPLPWLELVGQDGQLIQPEIPRGLCGQPASALLAALAHVKWRTVSRTLETKYKAVLDPLPPNAGG